MINKALQVAILDDDKDIAEDIRLRFLKDGHDPAKLHVYYEVADFMGFLTSAPDVHVAILDNRLGVLNPRTMKESRVGDDVIPSLQKRFGPLIMIVVTGYPDDREHEQLVDSGVKRVLKKGLTGADDLFPRIVDTVVRHQDMILRAHGIMSGSDAY
jgi:CheY-like chemotaxis protein